MVLKDSRYDSIELPSEMPLHLRSPQWNEPSWQMKIDGSQASLDSPNMTTPIEQPQNKMGQHTRDVKSSAAPLAALPLRGIKGNLMIKDQ